MHVAQRKVRHSHRCRAWTPVPGSSQNLSRHAARRRSICRGSRGLTGLDRPRARRTGESHMEPLTSSVYRPEHEAFRETLRRFLENELTPNIDAWERDGIIARSFWRRAGQIGLISP